MADHTAETRFDLSEAPAYGIHRLLPGVDFDAAVERTTAALAAESFGVLTTIDVQATMQKKLGLQTNRYVILGACNPPLAREALGAEPGIGLLLPCNVVVSEVEGGCAVAAIDPVAMFRVVERPDVAPLADAVGAKLRRVIAAI